MMRMPDHTGRYRSGLLPVEKAVQARLQGLIEAQDLAHAERRNHGALPDTVELPEVGQRDAQRDQGTVMSKTLVKSV